MKPVVQPLTETGRIQALTDGVYAIAMTILILNLHVPQVAQSGPDLIHALWGISSLFTNFVISFLLLAIFWVVHHQHFYHIKRADTKLLWINIFSLLFVVLIPFTTSVYGEYPGLTVAAIFFEANILVLGLIKYVQWSYATTDRRLVDPDLDQAIIDQSKRLGLVTPAVSVVAIGAAFISPDWSTLTFLSIPFIIRLARRL